MVIAGRVEAEATPKPASWLQPVRSASEKRRRSEFTGCSHSETKAESRKTSKRLALTAQNTHPARWDAL